MLTFLNILGLVITGSFLIIADLELVLQEVDDLTTRRFLRARNLDVEKASDMLLKCLKWRIMFVPSGHISSSEVPNEIAQNKMFVQGIDKKGRPIAVLIGARHFQNEIGGLDEFKRT